MNKTLFKRIAIVSAMVTLSLVSQSCEEKSIEPENPGQQENPEEPAKLYFSLNEKELEVPAEGGEVKVTYTLKNPVQGEKVTITTEATWLNEFDVETDGEIRFKADPNPEYQPRETVVSVKYSTRESEFSVRQLGQVVTEEEIFKITVSNVTETQFDVEVIPFDNEITYVANVITQALYDKKYKDDNDLIEDDLRWYEYLAGNGGMTIEEFLPKILKKGEYREHWVEQTADTELIFFAYGLTENAFVSTEARTVSFKTNAPVMIDMTFDLEISDMRKGSFRLDVTPGRDDVLYWFDFNSKAWIEEGEAQGFTLEDDIQFFLTQAMRQASYSGQTWEQVLRYLCSQGPDFAVYGKSGQPVTDNTLCVAYAMAVSDEGQICSATTRLEFMTYETE